MPSLRPQPQQRSSLSLASHERRAPRSCSTGARPVAGFGRARLSLTLTAALLASAFALSSADGASALTTAANCALPGSSFHGGDGNQSTPSIAEQAFCNEHILA